MKVKENNSMFNSCAQVSHVRIMSKSLNAALIFLLCLVADKLKDMERKKLLTVTDKLNAIDFLRFFLQKCSFGCFRRSANCVEMLFPNFSK